MIQRKHPLAKCEECPLAQKPCAKTIGPKDASVALVSRSPGYHEALAGKPFSGPSGKVLDYFLGQNGVKRKDILVTNTVLCFSEGKVPPAAIKACSGRLRAEIRNANTIIAAGSEAVAEILRKTGIDSLRGYEHTAELNGSSQRVIVTNNPALVLRDDTTFPNLQKDFKLAFNPRPPVTLPEVEVIDSIEDARRWFSDYNRKQGQLAAADIESRIGSDNRVELVSIQFATGDREKPVVFSERLCYNTDFQRSLKSFLESDSLRLVWHNGKYDIKVLKGYGIDAKVHEDTMLLSYLLDERPGYHSLEYLLADEFGWPNYEPQSVREFKKDGIIRDEREFYTYAGIDAAGTRELCRVFEPRIKDEGLGKVYHRLLIPASHTLSRMELRGIIYDVNLAADYYELDVRPELERLVRELQTISDNPLLNPRSPDQLADLYYDRWGVIHDQQKRPDKARSVDAQAREAIIEYDAFTTRSAKKARTPDELAIAERFQRDVIKPFTVKLDRFKKLDKQASTYLLALIAKAEKNEENRIFTEFNLIGTESGRLSSKGPNLQNVTRTKEGLPNIRSLFKPSPGRILVQADFSQAELRTIAVLSGDKNLQAIYRDTKRSLHKEMATEFYGPNYTSEQYVFSKNINFGVVYQQGAGSFAKMYHKPYAEAQRLIDLWWSRFPQVREWVDKTKREVIEQGYVLSPLGRRRRFYLITEENRDHSFKEAINFKAQSTASDITLSALIELDKQLDPDKAALVLTVHDSIVADVVEGYVESYTDVARQVMEDQPRSLLGWDLPFTVDITAGPSWGELTEVAAWPT